MAVALATLAASCGGSDATPVPSTVPWVTGLGGSITVGIDRAPTGCNPNSARGDTWANHFVLEPVLPSAFVTSPGGQSIYDSAVITQAEVQNLSPQTVVYSINPKAVWSDGRPIGAPDFIYAWQQQRGGVPVAGQPPDQMATTLGYRDIQSVTGSNSGRTVTVVFKTPFAGWQSLFADLLPAHVMAKVGWDPPCTTVDPAIDLSGGPFMIAKVVAGHEVVLAKNPRWWGESVDLDHLVIRSGTGTRQLTRWLLRGTAQAVEPSSFDEPFLTVVGSQPDLASTEQTSSTFLQLEFSALSPTTGVPTVRQAVAHAVDRQAMVDAVVGFTDTFIAPAASHLYSQSQDAYPGPTPPPGQITALPGYTPSTQALGTPSRPYPAKDDDAEVQRLLTEAGFTRPPGSPTWLQPDGKPFLLRLAVDDGDRWAAAAGVILAQQLGAAGIGVSVTPDGGADATGRALAAGAVDAALLPLTATPYPTQATAWYTPLLGPPGTAGSQDWMNYDDPALNSLLTQAAQQLNPVQASPLYAQADQLLWSSMIALPLFAEPTALAWSNSSSGIGPNPYGPGLLWYPQTWGIRVPPSSPKVAPH